MAGYNATCPVTCIHVNILKPVVPASLAPFTSQYTCTVLDHLLPPFTEGTQSATELGGINSLEIEQIFPVPSSYLEAL